MEGRMPPVLEPRTTKFLHTGTRSLCAGAPTDGGTGARIAGAADRCPTNYPATLWIRPLTVLSGSATDWSCNSHRHTSR